MRNDGVPMRERVPHKPIVRDLKERVDGDWLVLLGGSPLTDARQGRQYEIVGGQEESGPAICGPLTEFIGTSLQFSVNLLNTKGSRRRVGLLQPGPKCGAKVESVVKVLRLDEYI